MIQIYNNIKRIAEEKHISIGYLEKQAGLSSGSICKWNSSSPSANSLKKVADLLDVEVGVLLEEESA